MANVLFCRLEQERKQAAKKLEAESSTTTPKEKKRKRNDGEVPTSEDLINESNVKEHPGWKLDPKTHTPIFPLVMRPDHPLPPPPTIEPVAGPSSPKKDDKAKKTAKKADKVSKRNRKAEVEKDEGSLSPPTRARMVKIDPSLYPIKHLREEDLQNLPDTSKVKAKPVKIKKAEEPPIKKAKVALPAPVLEVEPESEDNMSRSSDEEQSSVPEEIKVQGGAPKATHKESSAKVNTAVEAIYDEQAAAAERKANLDLVAKLLGGIPKDLKPVEEAVQMQLDESDDEEDVDDDEDDSEAENETTSSENDSTDPSKVNIANNGIEAKTSEEIPVAGIEASRDTNNSDIPLSANKTASDASTIGEKGEDLVDEQEDSADEEVTASRREAEDVEEHDGSDTQSAEEGLALASRPAQVADVQMQSLTEMFKPQEAAGKIYPSAIWSSQTNADNCLIRSAGFSIGDLLDDVEMDDLEIEVPVPAAQQNTSSNITPWSAPAYATAPTRAPATTKTLFFPFPLEGDDLPGGLLHGMDGQERERVMDRSWTGTSNVRRFKRTQTM